MGDVVFVLVALAFFGAAVLFVRLCDRIVGPDDISALDPDPRSAHGASPAAGSGRPVEAE